MRPRKQPRSKTKIVIFSILAAIVILGLITFIVLKISKPKKIAAQVSTYRVETHAKSLFKGIVTAKHTDDYMLDAALGEGNAPTINVKSGQNVTAGEVIITYSAKDTDLTSLSYAVKTAQLTLSQAKDNLSAAQQQADKLKEKYNQALSSKAVSSSVSTSNNQSAENQADPSALQAQIASNEEAIKQQGYAVQTAQLNLEQAQTVLSNAQSGNSNGSNPSTDLTTFEYAVKQAQLTLSQAQDSMASLQSQNSTLKTQYTQALDDQKNAQKIEVQQANAQDPVAVQAEIDSNNQNIQQLAQAIATDSLAVESAQANLNEARNTGKLTVKAKSSGIAKVNDAKEAGKPLVSISTADTVITGQISEYDYSKLKVGDKVGIKTLNLQQTITGVVDSIATTPEAETSSAQAGSKPAQTATASYYTFSITPSKNLQVGYNVQISVSDERLLIPASAVKGGYVEVEKNGKFVKTAVKTQKSEQGQLQVLSGLKAGDIISRNGETE
jgi:HlyD family secretion protein